MKRITLWNRLRYQFDNSMSKGPSALIGWLFLASIVMVAIISLIVVATRIDTEGRSFFEIAWMSVMRTLDAGTMGGDTGSWPFLFSMLAVTIGGIFVVSTLIGVLTASVEGKLEDLQKGRSTVIERGHTVILGWSPQVFTIVSEIVTANANQRSSCIAILADQDKVEMEDQIRERVGKAGRTHIVCRTGNPIDLADLEIISPHTARAIIVLPPEADDPDAQVIKMVLALTNNPNRRPEPYHIVTAIRNAKNVDLAHIVGGDEAQLLFTGDLIAQVTAQTCRQSGLSVAYTELMNFGGDEIYFQEEPGLVGKTFGQALLAYEDSALIGLRFKDGRVQLNPPMDTRIAAGDQVIAVSADDDAVRLSGLADLGIEASAIRAASPRTPQPERTLILGWNEGAATIIHELDNYVAPGSQVTVIADVADDVADTAIAQLTGYQNLSVSFRQGDTTDRATLDGLEVATYQHIIVQSYADTLGPQEADARTLVTLLHLRDMAERCGHPFSIVSEMLDVRNRELAAVTRADDFIISGEMISLLLAQISENKELVPVFQDLFDPEGSELYMKPASDYVELGRAVNFYTVVESARQRGDVAIGYKLQSAAHDAEQSFGVKLNPPKSQMITFSEEDKVIALAEN